MSKIGPTVLLAALAGCSSGTDDLGQKLPDLPPSPTAALAYVATAGVNRPGFLPVSTTGPGVRSLIGPSRGAGYGRGEGTLALLGLAQGDSAVVVSFRGIDGHQTLFLLPLDGAQASDPVELVELRRPQRGPVPYSAISPDQRWLAFVDDGTLFTMPIDGSAPAVAHGSGIKEARTLTFSAESDRVIIDAADGFVRVGAVRGETGLRAVAEGDIWVAGVLPGSRALIRQGDVFFVHDLTGSRPPTRLTPPGGAPGQMVGVSGELLIVTYRAGSWSGHPTQLVGLPLDGSVADTPIVLSPAEASVKSPVLEGGRLLFVAEQDNQSTVYEHDLRTNPGLRPLAPSRPGTLYLAAHTAAHLVFCDGHGAILTLSRWAEPQWTQLIAGTSPSCDVQGVSGEGRYVVAGSSSTQYALWPLDGGAPIPLSRRPAAVLKSGLLDFEDEYKSSAIFVATTGGDLRLTPWLDQPIEEALQISSRLIAYKTPAPSGRWYVTALDGADALDLRPLAPAGVGGRLIGVVEGRAVIVSGPQVYAPRLDGSDAGRLSPLLPRDAIGQIAAQPSSGRIIAALGAQVVSFLADGANASHRPVLLDQWASALLADDQGAGVYAASGQAVFGTVADGSKEPSLIAELDGVTDLYLAPGRETLVMLVSTMDTAIPHPRQLFAAKVDGSERDQPIALGPVFAVPVAYAATGKPWDDQGWMALESDGVLLGVELDHPGQAQPLFALDRTPFLVAGGYGPDGRGLMGLHGEDLVHVSPSGAKVVTTGVRFHRGGAWAIDGSRFLLVTEATDATRVTAITPEAGSTDEVASFKAEDRPELLGASPTGDGLLFASSAGGDRSLYLVPWRGAVRAATPIDDAAEVPIITLEMNRTRRRPF